MSDVRFDEAEYALYQSVITQYDALMARKDELTNNIQSISNKLINHNIELLTIPSYDHKTKSLE